MRALRHPPAPPAGVAFLHVSNARPDLSKLRIDRSLAPVRSSRRRKWFWLAGLALVALVGGGWLALQPRAVAVQTTSVVTSYPSQQFVVLNASGYVAAAQGRDRVESHRSPRMARRRRRLLRSGRSHRPTRQSRRHGAGAKRRGQRCAARAGTRRRPRNGKRRRRSSAARTSWPRASCRNRRSTRRRRVPTARWRAWPTPKRDRRGRGQRAQRASRRRLHADSRAVRR